MFCGGICDNCSFLWCGCGGSNGKILVMMVGLVVVVLATVVLIKLVVVVVL